MVNLLSFQQTLLVTGAKKDNPSPHMIPPNFQPEPQPVFTNLPHYQPTPPPLDFKIHSGNSDYIHGVVTYNVNPSLSVGANAIVTKYGDIPQYGATVHYSF